MNKWSKTPFGALLVDSKDGEWGDGEETVGSRESIVIRGTDFANLGDPASDFPRRWIKNHIVDRKRLQPGDLVLETAGGTSAQSTGRSAILKQSFFDRHSNIPVLGASFSRHLRLKTTEYSPRFIYYILRPCIAQDTWRFLTYNTPVFRGSNIPPSRTTPSFRSPYSTPNERLPQYYRRMMS